MVSSFFVSCSVDLEMPVVDNSLRTVPQVCNETESTAYLISFWSPFFPSIVSFLRLEAFATPVMEVVVSLPQCETLEFGFRILLASQHVVSYCQDLVFHSMIFKQCLIDNIFPWFVRIYSGGKVNKMWFIFTHDVLNFFIDCDFLKSGKSENFNFICFKKEQALWSSRF